MACTVADVFHRGFVGGGNLGSVKKVLSAGWEAPLIPRGDSSVKEVARVPSRTSNASTPSAGIRSEDSEVDSQTAAAVIDRILLGLAAEMWHAERFDQIRTLSEAPRNQGSVELMFDKGGFGKVAVKQMPVAWTQKTPAAFAAVSSQESEQPWLDLGVVKYLSSRRFPHSCALHGVFQDDTSTYVVSELATEGDLLRLCKAVTHRGDAREGVIRPVAQKLCSAVAWLHDLGVAHGDISLENVLLTKSAPDEEPNVKLIDFGMSTTQRRVVNQERGKAMYQAPEMHVQNVPYDPFLSDVFAIGVVFFCLATQEIPWMSTCPSKCQFWHLMSMRGLNTMLGKRKPKHGKPGEFLLETLSPGFVELLEGMFAVKPGNRLTLGECTWASVAGKKSVWDTAWMNVSRGNAPRKTFR